MRLLPMPTLLCLDPFPCFASFLFSDKRDPCGPTYLNLGDGGNREGAYTPWLEQPLWSAFREASFGVAKLVIHNQTHSHFKWDRHSCEADKPGMRLGERMHETVTSVWP